MTTSQLYPSKFVINDNIPRKEWARFMKTLSKPNRISFRNYYIFMGTYPHPKHKQVS